jgi:hypothetical protein
MSFLSLLKRLTKSPIRIQSVRFLSLTQTKKTATDHTAEDFKAETESEKNNTKWSNSEEKLKEDILKNAMKYVPIYGFSVQSILEGSNKQYFCLKLTIYIFSNNRSWSKPCCTHNIREWCF